MRDKMLQRQLHSTQIREVVSVVADSKKTHIWHHGHVCELLKGKDGVIRGVRVTVRNKIMEQLCSLYVH